MRKIWAHAVIILFCLVSAHVPARSAEQRFPSRMIQVIIPFAPGDTDVLLRPFADKIAEILGQPLNFVYKPGAAGAVGAGSVAMAKPDGYNLMGASQSCLTIVPHIQKDLTYTYENFAPICCLVESPILLLAAAGAPWKDVKDLVADAKKNPGKINYTSAGAFNVGNIAHEAFAAQAGVKFNFIPSQGSLPAITAVLGGHVALASAAIAPALPHIKSGSLRPLAVYTQKRKPLIPDVPTFAESGYPVVAPVNYGFLAPAGTSPDVIGRIEGAARKAIDTQSSYLQDRLDNFGAQIDFMGSKNYAEFIRSQYKYYGEMIQRIK
ncbi:MAG TPA: tripartite tricarboxylate transporter substrate binding protein [Thermodesulfobacteriota bacterium]|nr:tripartite tricarboxylate transporter substrate binding protein [Thermodesulfobacteriota bacterium]